MNEYTPTKIWLKKRDYDNGITVKLPSGAWELSMEEPDYNEELYDEYIAIRIKPFNSLNDDCPIKTCVGTLIGGDGDSLQCNKCGYQFNF
jgi:hypothetical protein